MENTFFVVFWQKMEKCPKRQKTLFFNVFWPKMVKNRQNELNGERGERTQRTNENPSRLQ